MSETSRDEGEQPPDPAQGEMMSMAGDLLQDWEGLKEIFKIPKLQVEERKKREQELGEWSCGKM